MITTGRTHIGHKRRRNEDSLLLGGHLAAVADGMSGHVDGDVASRTVVDALAVHDRALNPGELGAAMARAVSDANEAMANRIIREPALAGMGTTLVAAMWSGRALTVANVGDSRAYLLRGGALLRLTDDHVYDRLIAHADVVPLLPERITRFLDGRADGRSADQVVVELNDGDRLLLCSDGLSSYVAEDIIQASLELSDLDQAADRLVEEALATGGLDNVSVIIVSL